MATVRVVETHKRGVVLAQRVLHGDVALGLCFLAREGHRLLVGRDVAAAAVVAREDGALTRGERQMVLDALVAADIAAVRPRADYGDLEFVENLCKRLVNVLEHLCCCGVVLRKRIGVHHDEFAGAQQARPWAQLVPVLAPDLVHERGHVLVAGDGLCEQRRDVLLAGGDEAELVLAAVLQFEELGVGPAAGGLPEGPGGERGERYELCVVVGLQAGVYDALELADGAHSEGQHVEEAALGLVEEPELLQQRRGRLFLEDLLAEGGIGAQGRDSAPAQLLCTAY